MLALALLFFDLNIFGFLLDGQEIDMILRSVSEQVTFLQSTLNSVQKFQTPAQTVYIFRLLKH